MSRPFIHNTIDRDNINGAYSSSTTDHMRLRLKELLDERDMSAYALVKSSNGRIDMTTAYRILQQDGRLRFFSAELLDTLLELLGVTIAELLEPEPTKRKPRSARRSNAQRAGKSGRRR